MFTRPPFSPARARRGFTLIEAAVVTAIVGIGIVAMLELLAAGTMANTESTEVTTAMALAGNIHERVMGVAYDSLFSTFDNKSYSPPIDANNNSITGMTNWMQTVDISYVDPDRISSPVPDTQVEPTARVTVSVLHNNRIVYQSSWLATASEWTGP